MKAELKAKDEKQKSKIDTYMTSVWKPNGDQHHTALVDLLNKTSNTILMEMASAIQVKLYYSTNKQDFYEFTA